MGSLDNSSPDTSTGTAVGATYPEQYDALLAQKVTQLQQFRRPDASAGTSNSPSRAICFGTGTFPHACRVPCLAR